MFVEWNTIRQLAPECLLIFGATLLFLGAAFSRSRAGWPLFALAVYAAAGCLLSVEQGGMEWFQGRSNVLGPLTMDDVSFGLRLLALSVGALFTLSAWREAAGRLGGEYLGMLMLVVAGMMTVSAANDLVLLFVGLELVSIPTYALLFLGRPDRRSAEATMKYFFLSVFSSALLLYGISFLYGLAGTTTIVDPQMGQGIREALERAHADGNATLPLLGPVALTLIVGGLGFKLAAAPFHFYAADVYQGASNPNAGLLAVAPKVAGVAALVRLVSVAAGDSVGVVWVLLMTLSVVTMTLGNVCALWQQNVRRLMAYSSIAHAGYLLIGLTVSVAGQRMGGGHHGGVAAMLLYLLVYSLASVGVFAALAALSGEQTEVRDVSQLAGLARRRPLLAAALAICLFSLAGIPPLAGFWGKLALLGGAVRLAADGASPLGLWMAVLAVVGALNAAVAAAYYLRVVGTMYFREPSDATVQVSPQRAPALAAAVCAVLVLGLGALPRLVVQGANAAERSVEPSDDGAVDPLGTKRPTWEE